MKLPLWLCLLCICFNLILAKNHRILNLRTECGDDCSESSEETEQNKKGNSNKGNKKVEEEFSIKYADDLPDMETTPEIQTRLDQCFDRNPDCEKPKPYFKGNCTAKWIIYYYNKKHKMCLEDTRVKGCAMSGYNYFMSLRSCIANCRGFSSKLQDEDDNSSTSDSDEKNDWNAEKKEKKQEKKVEGIDETIYPRVKKRFCILKRLPDPDSGKGELKHTLDCSDIHPSCFANHPTSSGKCHTVWTVYYFNHVGMKCSRKTLTGCEIKGNNQYASTKACQKNCMAVGAVSNNLVPHSEEAQDWNRKDFDDFVFDRRTGKKTDAAYDKKRRNICFKMYRKRKGLKKRISSRRKLKYNDHPKASKIAANHDRRRKPKDIR